MLASSATHLRAMHGGTDKAKYYSVSGNCRRPVKVGGGRGEVVICAKHFSLPRRRAGGCIGYSSDATRKLFVGIKVGPSYARVATMNRKPGTLILYARTAPPPERHCHRTRPFTGSQTWKDHQAQGLGQGPRACRSSPGGDEPQVPQTGPRSSENIRTSGRSVSTAAVLCDRLQ